jgi:hypothetical protein
MNSRRASLRMPMACSLLTGVATPLAGPLGRD